MSLIVAAASWAAQIWLFVQSSLNDIRIMHLHAVRELALQFVYNIIHIYGIKHRVYCKHSCVYFRMQVYTVKTVTSVKCQGHG